MDAFGDNFGDVDPAAEFLAREQTELAGLEDDLKPAVIANTPADGLSVQQDAGLSSANGSFEMINTIDQSNDSNVASFLQSEETKIEDSSIIFSSETSQGDLVDALTVVSGNASPKKSESAHVVITTKPLREEPEKIKKWREEQKKRLEEKDLNEEKKKEEWREAAKKELEEWYKHHDELIAKTKVINRNAEKELIAEVDEIEPGTEWERIAKSCDFNPKASKSSRDVSRMRSIILQLKQNPLPTKNKA